MSVFLDQNPRKGYFSSMCTSVVYVLVRSGGGGGDGGIFVFNEEWFQLPVLLSARIIYGKCIFFHVS